MSTYTTTITWTNDALNEFVKGRYTRGHTWSFDGGVEVSASSSPHAVRIPYSVEAAVDPEEALVAAASACHMLTFLWLASRKGFVVSSYTDTAFGEMTKGHDGKEWISRITLDPTIEWTGDSIPTEAEITELHHAAHDGCFIANSIKSEVIVKGV